MADQHPYALLPSHQLTSPTAATSPLPSATYPDGKGRGYDRVRNDDVADKDSVAYPSPALSSMSPSPGWQATSFHSPSTPFKSMEEVKRFDELRAKDLRLKNRIRRLKFMLRSATLVLALYTIITMSMTFHKFYSTRDTLVDVVTAEFPAPDAGDRATVRRGPWAKDSVLWPTTLLLVTSIVSLVVAASVMVSYLGGIGAANKVSFYGAYCSSAVLVTNTGLWIAVATAYRAGRTRADLWGWSCQSDVQQRLQPFFDEVVDFSRLCNVQTSSWIASILQTVVMVLFVLVYLAGHRRLARQRQMNRDFDHLYPHRESRWSRWIPTR